MEARTARSWAIFCMALWLMGAVSMAVVATQDFYTIDRLLEAVEAGLRHAKLHLVLLLLAFQSLRSGLTGKPFTARNRRGSGGIDRRRRSGCGGLRMSRDRTDERAYRDEGAP